MCDTLIALPPATVRGAALFAKNSDRERNEAQFLEMVPAGRHEAGTTVRATYIDVPQAQRTHACLLSRPFWMWGAEMGANARGVVIGNEAVHSRIAAPRRRALTGMDLVRLGLERGADAAGATQVIIDLLERHGQGGDCGHLGRFYYHNSFIIADPREAFVLETVGRWWAVERVEATRALSNALSIGTVADRISPALSAHAREQGWCDPTGRFDLAARLIDRQRDAISFGRGRCARAGGLLAAAHGALTPRAMMEILRDHGPEAADNPAWTPAETRGRTLCMHAAQGARRSQTTGSLVSELGANGAVHWVTGAAAPCLSLFKPVLFESGLPTQGARPTDRFDAATRWWRHELLHRRALEAYAVEAASIRAERDALEQAFVERVDGALARQPGADGLKRAVVECWREADAAEARWLGALAVGPRPAISDVGYRRSWARLNQVAGLPGRVAATRPAPDASRDDERGPRPDGEATPVP